MKAITKIGTTLFLMLIMLSASAQGMQKNESERAAIKEKMETLKIAFLTEKLDLTENEAKEFWPVYNQFEKDMKSLRPEFKKDKKELSSLSDDDLKEMMDNRFTIEQKRLDTEKAYNKRFVTIIGIQKTAKLYKAEHEFRKEMFEKIKGSHGIRDGQGPPPHHH